MTFAYLFFPLIIIYFFFLRKKNFEYRLPIFIFTIFFFVYNVYPFIIFDLIDNARWIKLNSKVIIKNSKVAYGHMHLFYDFKIKIYIILFYLLFLTGYFFGELFSKKLNLSNVYGQKILSKSYDYSLFLLTFFLLVIFLSIFNESLLISFQGYSENQRINKSIFAFLKYTTLFFVALCVISEKKFLDLKLFIYISCLILFSFATSDKGPFIIIFTIMIWRMILFSKKISVINLIILFILISLFLIIFFPIFSKFRVHRDFSFIVFEWWYMKKILSIGDPDGALFVLSKISDNLVKIEPFNFLYNFISFLPQKLRDLFEFERSYSIEFAKAILKNEYYDGAGYSFSHIAESLIYMKHNLAYAVLFILFLGISFNLSFKMLNLIVPYKYYNYLIIYLSSVLSIQIVRSTSAGYYQELFRFLIIIYIIYVLSLLFKTIFKK